MKVDVGQSVGRIETGTISLPHAVISEICDSFEIGLVDMPVTSQKILNILLNKQVYREA